MCVSCYEAPFSYDQYKKMGTESTQSRFYDTSKRGRVLSQIHHVLSLFSGMPKICDKSNERRELRRKSRSRERGGQFARYVPLEKVFISISCNEDMTAKEINSVIFQKLLIV